MKSRQTRKTLKRRTLKKRNGLRGGAKKMPTSIPIAIKRAKKAIQKYILHPCEKHKIIAEEEIENANNISKNTDRKEWKKELFIISYRAFSLKLGSTNWYDKTREVQWSLDKMPEWARNGKEEPDTGYAFGEHSYTKAPKSMGQ